MNIQYDGIDTETAADSRFHPEMATDAGGDADLSGNRRSIRVSQSQFRDGTHPPIASKRFSGIRTGQGAVVAHHIATGEIARSHR